MICKDLDGIIINTTIYAPKHEWSKSLHPLSTAAKSATHMVK